jgi:hypothetical protein
MRPAISSGLNAIVTDRRFQPSAPLAPTKSVRVKFNESAATGNSAIMKKYPFLLSLAVLSVLGLAALTASRAAVEPAPALFQYASIDWGGDLTAPARAHVYVVRPDGKVQFFDDQLTLGKVPEGCSQRTYFMNVVMNVLAKEGYEFASMTEDEIVMKKAAGR